MAAQLEPMPEDWQRALVIVAHPDDVEYGLAGAVAAWTDGGREICYLLITRGEAGIAGLPPEQAAPIREREQRASAALVGAGHVEFLDHRDGVIEEGVALRRDLARSIRGHRPELVLTVNHHDYWDDGAWNTPDHRAAGRSALDAVADAGNEWIFPELVQAGFRPWNGVRWVAVSDSPHPTHAVDVSCAVERQAASLAAHETYLAALTSKPAREYADEYVALLNAAAAPRFGGKPAVTFELMRH